MKNLKSSPRLRNRKLNRKKKLKKKKKYEKDVKENRNIDEIYKKKVEELSVKELSGEE